MKWNQVFKAHRMTRPENWPYRIKPKVQPDGEDEDESLPAHVSQDLKFCQAMVRAGYKLRELEEVRR